MKQAFVSQPADPVADPRRGVPSVERVLQELGPSALPRPIVVAEVRRTLAALRREPVQGGFDAAVARVRAALRSRSRQRLQVVVNATGVVLHTNFGRAPLGAVATAAVAEVAANYGNVEFDLEAGGRGGRGAYVEHALALLCEAEAATVVNNCAAALVLVLRHLTASRREVVLSRGELVQIGGGFRIPEILEASGAVLREVGTTNRTTVEDYARAIGPATGLVLKVHRSNFFMDGFVAAPPTAAIAALAHERGVPFAEDLGSGAVFATDEIAGVEPEPTPAEVLRHGADLVTFSGDKLLGGPQAGIIAGSATLVAALKREPFFRALRCDKLAFAALQATVDAHLADTAATELPVQVMLRASEPDLRARAERMAAALSVYPVSVEVTTGPAEIGGGCLPRSAIPSVAIELASKSLAPAALARRLAEGDPPVIGTVARGRCRLDFRTVFPSQDDTLVRAIGTALAGGEAADGPQGA